VRAQGRCAGCQLTGELKTVGVHVIKCAKWAELYRKDPAAALSPKDEYERWRDSERAAEHRADLEDRIADTQRRRAASVARFQVLDPLED
jgi:hypothetical protein